MAFLGLVVLHQGKRCGEGRFGVDGRPVHGLPMGGMGESVEADDALLPPLQWLQIKQHRGQGPPSGWLDLKPAQTFGAAADVPSGHVGAGDHSDESESLRSPQGSCGGAHGVDEASEFTLSDRLRGLKKAGHTREKGCLGLEPGSQNGGDIAGNSELDLQQMLGIHAALISADQGSAQQTDAQKNGRKGLERPLRSMGADPPQQISWTSFQLLKHPHTDGHPLE